MRTVLRLTVAKIRAHIYRSLFQSGAVATTAFTLSFLLIFSINASVLRAGFKESHFTKFLSKMADALGISLLLVGLIAAVSVFVYMRIWHENGEIFSGRLASVGANEGQLAAISFVELTVLYLVPVFVGASLGAPVAGLVTGWMSSSLSISATGVMGVTEALFTSTLTAAGLFALILIFALAPTSRKKRGTVIERIKRHNKDEIGERHGYDDYDAHPVTSDFVLPDAFRDSRALFLHHGRLGDHEETEGSRRDRLLLRAELRDWHHLVDCADFPDDLLRTHRACGNGTIPYAVISCRHIPSLICSRLYDAPDICSVLCNREVD
jgi:hypothetical protein